MKKIKAWIRRMPGGAEWLRRRHSRANLRRFENFAWTRQPTDEVFEQHFRKRAWRNEESVSGTGSTLAYTVNLRAELPVLVERLGVRSLLDAPCGDFNWMKEVEWRSPINYIGGDIVRALVEENQKRYGSPKRRFLTLDLTSDPLPEADLFLCRDCLFHLSERNVFAALANFMRSDLRWLLTSVHPEVEENLDIPDGGFRQFDLRKPPFSFPEPEEWIDDTAPGHYRRLLGLWTREQVIERAQKNRRLRQAFRRLRDS